MISLAGAAALLLAAAGLADFGFGSTLLILLLTAVLCCAGHALLKRVGQGRWFAPGLLLLLLLLTLLFRRYLLEGGRLYWNQLSVAVTEGRGWVLPRLETQLPAAQRGSAIAVFAVVLSGLCSLAACGLAPCAPMALAVAGPILFFAGRVFTGDSAESIYLVLILASAALILIGCGWKKTSAAGSTALAWLLFAAVAFFAVQALSAPAVTD